MKKTFLLPQMRPSGFLHFAFEEGTWKFLASKMLFLNCSTAAARPDILNHYCRAATRVNRPFFRLSTDHWKILNHYCRAAKREQFGASNLSGNSLVAPSLAPPIWLYHNGPGTKRGGGGGPPWGFSITFRLDASTIFKVSKGLKIEQKTTNNRTKIKTKKD